MARGFPISACALLVRRRGLFLVIDQADNLEFGIGVSRMTFSNILHSHTSLGALLGPGCSGMLGARYRGLLGGNTVSSSQRWRFFDLWGSAAFLGDIGGASVVSPHCHGYIICAVFLWFMLRGLPSCRVAGDRSRVQSRRPASSMRLPVTLADLLSAIC